MPLMDHKETEDAESCANKFVLDNWSHYVESLASNGE